MKIVCEVCGGSHMIKKDGVFVCEDCGCKYSLEEVKKMLEGAPVVEKKAEPAPVEDKTDELLNQPPVYQVAIKVEEVGHISYMPTYHYAKGADGEGRVGCRFKVKNCGNRTIESLDVTLSGYNSKHQICADSASGQTERVKHVNGPIAAGEIKKVSFEGGWYHQGLSVVEVKKAEVSYSDGTKMTFDEANFPSEYARKQKSAFNKKS